MRRIAFFQTDLRVGGVQKSLINVIKALGEREDCQVDLYLYDNAGSFFDWPDNPRVTVYHCPAFFFSLDRVLPFALVRRLAGDVTQGRKYDVAADFNSYRNECAVGALKADAKKRVMWIHNDVEIKLKNEVKYKVLWHFFKGKFRHFDGFAAVSPGIIAGFRRKTGLAGKEIAVVPNYIDTEEIFRKRSLPCELRVDPQKLNLCTVGRLCHQKGYDILLDDLALVKEKRQDFHMYFIGDGPDRQALTARAGQLGLSEYVSFLGNQPNPFNYMHQMDGFVLTSRYEGQGMVIWEAKALGLPLYISKNLEAYNPGIEGIEDIPSALIAAKKPEKKEPDDLRAYNDAITGSLLSLFGLSQEGSHCE